VIWLVAGLFKKHLAQGVIGLVIIDFCFKNIFTGKLGAPLRAVLSAVSFCHRKDAAAITDREFSGMIFV